MPLSLTGTALINPARFAGDSDGSDTPEAIAASCNRPMRDRRQVRRLAQEVRERLLAARRRQPRDQIARVEIGPQRDVQCRLPRCAIASRNRRRQRIDRAALDAGARDDGLAAHGVRSERQRDALSGWPSKRSRKISDQATVKPQLAGRSGDIVDALRGERFHPCAIRAKPRPACAAERQHGRASFDGARRHPASETTDGRCSSQPVQRWRSANCTPGESSRRSHARSSGEALNAFGNTRPLEPTKVGCPSASLHSRNASGGNASIARCKMRHRLAVAREKCRQRLAMREIEPAAPRHQQFAARRRHRVIDGDVSAALRQHLGRHQPGRAGADDGDVFWS